MSEASSLLRLQEVDLSLIRLRTALAAMPQQDKLRAIALAKRKLAVQLKQIVGRRKDIETELSDNEGEHAHILEVSERVRSEVSWRVQGYRQVQDLEAQLTSLAKRQEKLEFSHAEIAARLERALKAERNARALGERLLAEEAAQTESFESSASDLSAQVRALERERAALCGRIEAGTLADYDAATRRFGGLAVEALRSNVPSTCRVKLQPGTFQALQKGPRITRCPYCHRMLVIEEVGS